MNSGGHVAERSFGKGKYFKSDFDNHFDLARGFTRTAHFAQNQENRVMKPYRQLYAVLLLPASLVFASCAREDSTESQSDDPGPAAAIVQEEGTTVHTNAVTEAPTGFDDKTNGFVPQATFDAD